MVHRKRGFSILEIIIVISIVSVISIATGSSFIALKNRTAFDDDVIKVHSLLREAQLYSKTGYTNNMWSVQLQDDTVTLFQGDDYVSRNVAFDSSYTLSSRSSIIGPESLTFQEISGYPTIVSQYDVSDQERKKNIYINAHGTITND